MLWFAAAVAPPTVWDYSKSLIFDSLYDAGMDLADELFQLADIAAGQLEKIRVPSLQKPLVALRDACEQVRRAWSGSNLGYHAAVYFAGLEPKPPGVEFSPEWGLMDRWPTHQPNPGWQQMDFEAVITEIIRRAGNPDIEAIKSSLAGIREIFLSAQETATSILSTALSGSNELFLERKLQQVQALSTTDVETIAMDLVNGPSWSRDSLAISQGKHLAPHQKLVGLHLSATVLENGLDSLERATRELASHLRRIGALTKKAGMVGANVFIGHGRSALWRELKDFIEGRLHLPVDEFNSVPIAGIPTSARLAELLDSAAFAFLIMTAEDEQHDGKVRARENVVHEFGLFQGRLGFARAIVLLEEGCEEFSNIHGLGQIRFPKGTISAKFEDIRAVLQREKLTDAL